MTGVSLSTTVEEDFVPIQAPTFAAGNNGVSVVTHILIYGH